ncbi:MAG: MarR family transcriptional regulator [Chloroflexia bacterium]|nr:MarR family transcriptional regulator [Chloroflexia bacterium]MDQ3514593.1 MarR family transcriptional regulator [Chloroflexota bacterium]
MTSRPDDLRLAAYRSFITAHAEVVGQIERELSAAGVISLTWYDVLIELYESPNRRLRLRDLARAVVLSRSGLTRTVDRLERAGLLRREPDPTDRRGAFAVISEDGIAAMRAAWPTYALGIVNTFARHLDDDEARVITAAFERIRVATREG